MPHLLDDCWLLIGRAETQFDALRSEVVDFWENNQARLVVEDDAQTGEKVISFAQEPILPREWGADVGQLINNARTALDHLIYALAIEGGGSPESQKTGFPIFQSRIEYLKIRGRGTRQITVRDQHLAGVDERWRKKIDDVQPYRRGQHAYLDNLTTLAEIANSHKHKTLKTARVTIETPTHICFATSGATSEIAVRFDASRSDHISVEAKMHGGRSLTPSGVVVLPKMQMEGEIQAGLVFGDPPHFYTLIQVNRAVRWSRAIIKWLEPAFEPGV